MLSIFKEDEPELVISQKDINSERGIVMYSYGEIGYEPESQFSSLQDLDAAVSHSVDMGSNPIGVSDDSDQLLYVVIEGEVFKKTTEVYLNDDNRY
jgi:hypothetical protein